MKSHALIDSLIEYDTLDYAVKRVSELIDRTRTEILDAINSLIKSSSETLSFLATIKQELEKKLEIEKHEDKHTKQNNYLKYHINEWIKEITSQAYARIKINEKLKSSDVGHLLFELGIKFKQINSFLKTIDEVEKNKDKLHQQIKDCPKEYINQEQKNILEMPVIMNDEQITTKKEIISFPLHLANNPDVIRSLIMDGADVNQTGYAKLPKTQGLLRKYEEVLSNFEHIYNIYIINRVNEYTIPKVFLNLNTNYPIDHITALETACYEWHTPKIFSLISLDDIAPCKMTAATIQNAILMIMNTKRWTTDAGFTNASPTYKEFYIESRNILNLLFGKLTAKQLLPILDKLKDGFHFNINDERDFIKSQLAKKIDRTSLRLLIDGNLQFNSPLSSLPKDILPQIINNVIHLDFKFFGKKPDIFAIDMFKKIFVVAKNIITFRDANSSFLDHNNDKSDHELLKLIQNESDSLVKFAWELAKQYYLKGFSPENNKFLVNSLANESLKNDVIYQKLEQEYREDEKNTARFNSYFDYVDAIKEKVIDQMNEVIKGNTTKIKSKFGK